MWISLSDFPKTSLIVEISTTFPEQMSCWMAACAVSGNCLRFPTEDLGRCWCSPWPGCVTRPKSRQPRPATEFDPSAPDSASSVWVSTTRSSARDVYVNAGE